MGTTDNSRLRVRVGHTEAERADNEKFFATGVAVIAFPIATGILGAFTPALFGYSGFLTALAWSFVALMYGIAYFRTFPNSKSFVALSVENEKLERDLESAQSDVASLQQSIELLSTLNSINYASRRMAATFITKPPTGLDELSEMCSELLAPIYLEGETLFGLQGSERWNFAVYLHRADTDELRPVWREKSLNHPSEGLGRVWTRGRGHVGKAFVDGQPIITGDATHPDVAQFCSVNGASLRDYDDEVYRSFASFPIGPVTNGNEPLGVLVATSDRVGRFNKENTAVLLHLADTLAAILQLADVNVVAILDREQGDKDVAAQ